MDTQIENHLPLITSRVVFAPKVFLRPPTITSRMEFPSIDVEPRDDSPAPENGHLRAGTPKRARTPGRAHTPGPENSRARTPGRAGTPARDATNLKQTKVTFDNSRGSSPLTEKSDSDTDEEISGNEVDHVDNGGEGMIPKPKGEVGRPGGGGYTLSKALDWNMKTYDNIHVSNRVFMKESLLTNSPRHS
jgi:hypothetical protein